MTAIYLTPEGLRKSGLTPFRYARSCVQRATRLGVPVRTDNPWFRELLTWAIQAERS